MPQSEVVFRVSSPAFDEGAAIPARLTADGADVSPELWIENVPEGTVSLALIMDDPESSPSIRGSISHPMPTRRCWRKRSKGASSGRPS